MLLSASMQFVVAEAAFQGREHPQSMERQGFFQACLQQAGPLPGWLEQTRSSA